MIDAVPDAQAIIQGHLKNGCGFVLRRVYSSAEEAFRELSAHLADVVLVHVSLAGTSGIECVYSLKRLLPRLPVVLLADEVDLTDFLCAFQAGADGHFVLPGSGDTLRQTLQYALDGRKSFSQEFQSLLLLRLRGTGPQGSLADLLTATEQKIMACLVLGYSDKEIAMSARISTATVHSFTGRIYKKLGVHHRRDAVAVFLGLNRSPASDEPGDRSAGVPPPASSSGVSPGVARCGETSTRVQQQEQSANFANRPSQSTSTRARPL